MVSNQQFRLKWNNHRNTVLQEFETLLHNNSFVDCTIGADGKYLKAHKIVLSACSPYLQNVFSEHFDKHPVILLKDVSFKELKCMIDYMYCGEVNISECELPSFLRTAQSLKIKGLAEDINEYDDSGASDNEHQEISSLTENGRTVEPSVEIHDDEGPPIKRSAPSLIYSNFAGRKRKSPNAISSGTPKSSNNGDKVIAAPTSKTGGNVPSCADTDNSDSTVCTTSKDSSVNKDDNDKKSNSQDDLQEHKNKAVVKEEPLDADDDNSSYEFVNNPCDDSDPLNEDSESNCANSGKNFNEVSIANVSSCNEAEANDPTLTKRASSRNARLLVSQWCEGLAGKSPKKLKHVKKYSSKDSAEKQTLEPSDGSKPFDVNCSKCGKFYKWRSSLNQHVKYECCKPIKYYCKMCKYRTHYPNYFKKHMLRVHQIRLNGKNVVSK